MHLNNFTIYSINNEQFKNEHQGEFWLFLWKLRDLFQCLFIIWSRNILLDYNNFFFFCYWIYILFSRSMFSTYKNYLTHSCEEDKYTFLKGICEYMYVKNLTRIRTRLSNFSSHIALETENFSTRCLNVFSSLTLRIMFLFLLLLS